MTQLGLDTFYVADENICPAFARALAVAGFEVTCVAEAFDGRKRVPDEEIIDWLANRGQKNAVWITKDWEAQKRHAKLIHEKNISVLWVFNPQGGLRALRELQLLTLVIEHVDRVVEASPTPSYLQASFNVQRPKLQRIVNPLTDKKLVLQTVPLRR